MTLPLAQKWYLIGAFMQQVTCHPLCVFLIFQSEMITSRKLRIFLHDLELTRIYSCKNIFKEGFLIRSKC